MLRWYAMANPSRSEAYQGCRFNSSTRCFSRGTQSARFAGPRPEPHFSSIQRRMAKRRRYTLADRLRNTWDFAASDLRRCHAGGSPSVEMTRARPLAQSAYST